MLWFHGGYHKLDIGASEEMRGHSVAGMKDVRVMYASLDGENEHPSPPITSTVLVFSPVKQGDFHYDFFFPTRDLLRYEQVLLE